MPSLLPGAQSAQGSEMHRDLTQDKKMQQPALCAYGRGWEELCLHGICKSPFSELQGQVLSWCYLLL